MKNEKWSNYCNPKYITQKKKNIAVELFEIEKYNTVIANLFCEI